MRSERKSYPLMAPAPQVATVLAALSAGRGCAAELAINEAAPRLPANAVLAACFVSIDGVTDLPAELELIPAGEFKGRDGRAWTNDRPDELIATSERLRQPAGYCVDVDHQLAFAANERVGGEAPAYGWIVGLENRGGAIWGKVEWTELGINAVRGRIYRGLSPVFAYDKDSGRVLALWNASLTNKPNLFLAAFNAASNPSLNQETSMNWIAKLLGLKEDASEADIRTALNSLLQLATTLAGAIGVDLPAALALNAETMSATLKQKFGTGSEVLVALCSKAGVEAGATADAILAALQAQASDPAKFVPMVAHLAVKSQLDQLLAGEPARLVEQALNERRISPAMKDWALAYAQKDLEGFKTYAANATPMLAAPPTASSSAKAGEHGLTVDDIAVCTRMGVDPKDFAAARKLEDAAA